MFMEKQNIEIVDMERMLDFRDSRSDVYYDGCLISTRDSREADGGAVTELLKYPYRINAFCLVLCIRGEFRITSNLNNYTITENTLWINKPNDIISAAFGDDCRVVLVIMSDHFLRKLHIDGNRLTPMFLGVRNTACFRIGDEEMEAMLDIVDKARNEMRNPAETPFYDDIVQRCIELAVYKMCSIVSTHVNYIPEEKQGGKSRNDEYFRKFMHLLGENYRKERSVGFYASQLFITPKYLTTVIRQVSGKSAADWIDEYVVLEAKNLLKYSTMSIQEVAYALNFSNQSFFGKYFKHHTGMSPSTYKMQR